MDGLAEFSRRSLLYINVVASAIVILPTYTMAESAETKSILGGEDIRRVIIGNTMKFRSRDRRNLAIHFEKDGKVNIRGRNNSGRLNQKNWWIKNGNILCRTFGVENRTHCGTFSPGQKPNTYNVVNMKGDYSYLATFLPGNQLYSRPKPAEILKAKLKSLKQLVDGGLITKQQYAAKQQALLDKSFGGANMAVKKTPPPKPKFDIPANIKFGNYHALIIGINKYKNISNLKTAEADAKAMEKLLRENYSFKTNLLLNPTRDQIVDSFDDLRATLTFKDNLVIYYAGHGWLDVEGDEGYWLPADAKPDRRSKWVSNATLTNTLRAIKAKHVIVLADSCYSGRLVRGANINLPTAEYLQKMSRKKARVVITSGGLEPVEDGKGDSLHSPFTNALLDSLGSNTGVIDGNSLFNAIRRPVMISADQTPQYSDVRKAGHDGGDFLFVRRN